MINSMDEPTCRICLETNGILFSPCLCNGTMKYVHETCLDVWRKYSTNVLSNTHCEQCNYPYNFKSTFLRTTLIYGGLVGLVGFLINSVFNTTHNSIILGVNILGGLGLVKLASSPIFIFIGMTIFTKDITVLNINLLAFIIIVTGNYNIIRVIDSISHKRILSL